ncbi:hypothetical protein GCM10010195_14530 [Kitasatospora griseola]|nr:hypothetical protein GCM10010195_14530 [Kitasatospora griseola]
MRTATVATAARLIRPAEGRAWLWVGRALEAMKGVPFVEKDEVVPDRGRAAPPYPLWTGAAGRAR